MTPTRHAAGVLCFSHIPHESVEIPFCLHSGGRDRRRFQVMSKNQRAATTREFALWLVGVAKAAYLKARK